MSMWYVITGAPSCGKTTVVNSLAKMGYKVVPEVARVLIDEEVKNGRTLKDIRKDEFGFQKRILKTKLEIEKKLPKNEIIFFDRGIPDNVAYLKAYNIDYEHELKICKKKSYRKIFILDRLPFEKDYARIENEEMAAKIHRLIKEVYTALGYEVIEVPLMSVKKRVKMILSNIDSL